MYLKSKHIDGMEMVHYLGYPYHSPLYLNRKSIIDYQLLYSYSGTHQKLYSHFACSFIPLITPFFSRVSFTPLQ